MHINTKSAVALGAAALISSGAFAADGEYVHGVVTDIDIDAYMNTLTIEDRKTGEERIFEVLPGTKITLESGRSGSLAQIDEGDTVKLDVIEDGEGGWRLSGFSRDRNTLGDAIDVETEYHAEVVTETEPAEPVQPFVPTETESRYEIASAYNDNAYDALPRTASSLPNLLLGALGLFAAAGGIRVGRSRRAS